MKKIILAGLLAASGNASALIVNTTNDAAVLAGVIDGSGITIDYGTATYVGAAGASGTFTDGLSSGIGMNEGIILTSGTAADAVGPNTSTGTSTNNNMPGDADLNGLSSGTSLDAASLSFDFTSTGGNLFFNFVFASEEYSEYLSFIDLFGLFIDGVNYAIAPDGQEISVGTINCGPTGTGTGPNCGSFNNNNTAAFDIEYDGFSDVFTAEVLGLSAGVHTMKFAISDANDYILDSAVFVQAESFSDKPPVETPEPSVLALLSLGVIGLGVVARRRKSV